MRFVIQAAVFVFMAGATPAVGQEKDKEKAALIKKELENLQGSWKIASVERMGEKVEIKEELPTFDLVIRGATLTVNKSEAMIVIDPTTDPKLIDLTYQKQKVTLETIYRLDGDTLTLCYRPGNQSAKERPVQFKTDEKSNYEIRVYKREKK